MRRISFYVVAALGLIAFTSLCQAIGQEHRPPEAGASLDIGGEVEHPRKLTPADLAALPRKSVQVKLHDGSNATFEGVALGDVLKLAGVTFGESIRGARLATYLLVEAGDDYRVVFALPELDPAFSDKQVILSDRKDGKPMAAPEGPFRLVVPEEKRQARWVRQVTALNILKAPGENAKEPIRH